MKLLLLLSDETQIANRRDAELRAVHTEKEEIKRKVADILDVLLRTTDKTSEAHFITHTAISQD